MPFMRKKPPLGSGLFDFNQPQPSPFALGSGLFDQPMPNQQEIAQAPAPAAGGGLFDDKLNALLSSPAFILGMNLLGASNQANPWGTALNGTLQATSAMAKNKRDQEKMQQDAEQHRQQMELSRRNADIQERHAQRADERAVYEIPYMQAQTEALKARAADIPADNARQAAQAAQEQAIWESVMGQLGMGGQGAPRQPAPMPFSTPQTPGAPAVPPAWQQMRGDFKAQQPTRESERIGILQQELQNEIAGPARPEHIEGLKREIAATLTGQAPAPAAPAPGGPGSSLTPQAPLGPSQGVALGLAAARLKNPQLAALASSMTPKIEGGYMHNPVDGSVVQLRDVYKDAQAQRDAAHTGIALSSEQRQTDAAATKKKTDVADMQAGFRAVDSSLDRMGQLADGLSKHPGLDTVGGWSGFFGLHKIPGEGKDASAKLDSLKSQLVVNALGELKKMSSTGASGFGQLSEKEGERLESLVTSLQAAQSDEQIRAAVREIAKFSAEARGRLRDHYNSLPGSAGSPLQSMEAAPAAPAAMSLDDYLKSKRPQRSDIPISPREARGLIR